MCQRQGVWNAIACFENLLACFENMLLHVCGSASPVRELREAGRSKEIFEERFLQEVEVSECGGSRAGKHSMVKKQWHAIGDKGMLACEQHLQRRDKTNVSIKTHQCERRTVRAKESLRDESCVARGEFALLLQRLW